MSDLRPSTRMLGTITIVLGAVLAGCAASAATRDAAPPTLAAEVAAAEEQDAYYVRLTHDHVNGASTQTFVIAAGGGPYDVTLAHYPLGEPPAGECANVDARIELFGPSGVKVYGFGGVTWAGPTIGPCSVQANVDHGLAAGTWTAKFSGFGALTGVVEIAE